MGKLFLSLGLLATDEVVEVSAPKFSTGFVGQAGQNTRKIFESALGRVLFIDEAYRLNPAAGGANFNQEIVDESVCILGNRIIKNLNI